MKKTLILLFVITTLYSQKSYLDKTKEYIDHHYFNTLKNLDSYLSNDYKPHGNEIYKNRLYIILSLQTKGIHDIKPTIYLHSNLYLPKTQKKIYLVFDRYSNEDNYKEQAYESLDNKDQENTKVNVGLKYFLLKKKNRSIYTQFGVKFKSPLKFYFKLGGDKRVILDKWIVDLENNFYYYLEEDGFLPSVSTTFTRVFNNTFIFKNNYEITYKSGEQLFKFINKLKLYHYINKKNSIIYSIYFNALFDDNCTFCSNLYTLSLIYTKKLKSWLYLDFIPKVDFLRENSFDKSFSFILNCKIIFNKQ